MAEPIPVNPRYFARIQQRRTGTVRPAPVTPRLPETRIPYRQSRYESGGIITGGSGILFAGAGNLLFQALGSLLGSLLVLLPIIALVVFVIWAVIIAVNQISGVVDRHQALMGVNSRQIGQPRPETTGRIQSGEVEENKYPDKEMTAEAGSFPSALRRFSTWYLGMFERLHEKHLQEMREMQARGNL